MPSPTTIIPNSPDSPSPLSLKRRTMSVTQTYHLAHTARGKLAHEAARPEHRLHRLVTHANLLDSLMLDLQRAEEEQERWFNQTVKKVLRTGSQPHKVRWADKVVEEAELDWRTDDVEEEEEDVSEDDDDESDVYDEEDDEVHDFVTLTRVPSHNENVTLVGETHVPAAPTPATPVSPTQPTHAIPELDDDLSSDDEDVLPKSPEAADDDDVDVDVDVDLPHYYPSTAATKMTPTTTTATRRKDKLRTADEERAFFDAHFYRPGELVTAISVY